MVQGTAAEDSHGRVGIHRYATGQKCIREALGSLADAWKHEAELRSCHGFYKVCPSLEFEWSLDEVVICAGCAKRGLPPLAANVYAMATGLPQHATDNGLPLQHAHTVPVGTA